jgi:serine/threonine-protein kinase RsbW
MIGKLAALMPRLCEMGSFMVPETPTNHSIVVESRPSAVTGQWAWILPKLKARNFSEDDIFAVHLALEEAFINAVNHGNRMDPEKEVKIEYFVGAEKVEISMTDEGQGFDPEAVPDPRYGENLYKAGGRGLLLMCSYMDIVEFSKSGNRVRMVRYKERPNPKKIEPEGKLSR